MQIGQERVYLAYTVIETLSHYHMAGISGFEIRTLVCQIWRVMLCPVHGITFQHLPLIPNIAYLYLVEQSMELNDLVWSEYNVFGQIPSKGHILSAK